MNRKLTGGTLRGDARSVLFRLNGNEVLEYQVSVKAVRVLPFDLAVSWRAYKENLQPSTVRGIPDVSINSVPDKGPEVWKGSQMVALLVIKFLSMLYDPCYGTSFMCFNNLT
ncbi:hypothetical protein U1Q18_007767 [Sarracenia purpurea var. burkii]